MCPAVSEGTLTYQRCAVLTPTVPDDAKYCRKQTTSEC